MSAHMKARLTKQATCKVVIEMPGKAKKQTFVPAKHLQKLEDFLEKYGESDLSLGKNSQKIELPNTRNQDWLCVVPAIVRVFLKKSSLKRTGISQENISKMENGQRAIGEKVAKRLAKALRIDFELLTGTA